MGDIDGQVENLCYQHWLMDSCLDLDSEEKFKKCHTKDSIAEYARMGHRRAAQYAECRGWGIFQQQAA